MRMTFKSSLFFTQGMLLPLSKIGHVNDYMILTLENYLARPVRNTSLLISGSVITLNSLNQWHVFDIGTISGGSVEQTMIINALSILQFFIGWQTIAKKKESKTDDKEPEQEIDSKIITLQSEIDAIKLRLGPN